MFDMGRSTMARTVSVALLAVLAGGCDSFLDVNTDPNAPVTARVDVRIPAVVTGMVHTVYYGDPGQWTVEWMQQTSYNRDSRSYDELQRYEVQDNSANGAWSFHYATMLNELHLMMEELDPEQDPAYFGLAQFLSTWVWAHTTDLWGPVPFTEALDPTVPTPAYDDQLPTIYGQMLADMDAAVAAMKQPSRRTPARTTCSLAVTCLAGSSWHVWSRPGISSAWRTRPVKTLRSVLKRRCPRSAKASAATLTTSSSSTREAKVPGTRCGGTSTAACSSLRAD